MPIERGKTIWFQIRPNETGGLGLKRLSTPSPYFSERDVWKLTEAGIVRHRYSSRRCSLSSFVKLGQVELFSAGAGNGGGGRRGAGVVEAKGD